MYKICTLNKDIYRCLSADFKGGEVIITRERLNHIAMQHSESFTTIILKLREALLDPDYILEENCHPNTGIILKEIHASKNMQVILRIRTDTDPQRVYCSVISAWIISRKRKYSYLRNKKILYKRIGLDYN